MYLLKVCVGVMPIFNCLYSTAHEAHCVESHISLEGHSQWQDRPEVC